MVQEGLDGVGYFETGFIDKFKQKCSDKASQWLSMAMQAFLRSSDIQKVYSKLETKDSLARHSGPQFVSANITPGGPDIYVANINVFSNKESCDIIKGNLGTFARPFSLTMPPADVGAVLLKDVASFIATKEDRVEPKRLKKGFVCQKVHYTLWPWILKQENVRRWHYLSLQQHTCWQKGEIH